MKDIRNGACCHPSLFIIPQVILHVIPLNINDALQMAPQVEVGRSEIR
jgi:hypothetical protein